MWVLVPLAFDNASSNQEIMLNQNIRLTTLAEEDGVTILMEELKNQFLQCRRKRHRGAKGAGILAEPTASAMDVWPEKAISPQT